MFDHFTVPYVDKNRQWKKKKDKKLVKVSQIYIEII